MRTLCAVDSRGSPTKSDPFGYITVTESKPFYIKQDDAKSRQ